MVARADTGADADAALAVAGAIIEATEDTLPTHYEVGESIRAEHPLAGWSLQCWGKGV